MSSKSSITLCPSSLTPNPTNTGTEITFLAILTRNAMASRYTTTIASLANDRLRHWLNSASSRPTNREIELLDNATPRNNGDNAPRMRRPLAPLR